MASLGNVILADLTVAPATELAALNVKKTLELTGLFERLATTVADLRPKLVILDTRADVFAGNEIDRSQVRTFIRALRRLCLSFDMAVLLLSHPSVSGLTSSTGQSGSTAWGNSVRSRLYLERPKAGSSGEADPDLRVLTTKKANYGAGDLSTVVRWDRGVFRLDQAGTVTLDRMARDRQAEDFFIHQLRAFEAQGRYVSNARGSNYAAKCFADASGGRFGSKVLAGAMERLFAADKIKIAEFGPPSRRSRKVVEAEPE